MRAAPSNEPSPLRRTRAPEPTHAGRATIRLPSAAPRVSHPLRAFTVPCAFPGLFHPGPALGVFTLQGLLPLQSRYASRRPRAFLTFPRRRPRPTVLPVRGNERHAFGAPACCHAGGQAPVGATPDRPVARACSRSIPTTPRGVVPELSRSLRRFGRPVAARRTSAGSPSRLFSLQRARSSRLAVRPGRGRGPHGFRLSRARSHRAGVGTSLCRPPLSGFRDRVRSFLRTNRRPLRGLPPSMPGPVSRETRRPS